MTGSALNENTSFHLHTLGWKAFESLSRAVTASFLDRPVVAFRAVRDEGRDGASYSPAGDGGEVSVLVQSKHSSKAGAECQPSVLDNDLSKIAKMHQAGNADVFVLATNRSVSSATERALRRTIKQKGPSEVWILGREAIEERILHDPRLRLMVPSVYGLGDLSQILDERRYLQAQSILEVFRERVDTFVITTSYRKAAAAMDEHGFVLLLGEAASGKTTIASALALGAVDIAGVRPVVLNSIDDLPTHWNPREPKQLFWIDDAFGATQFEVERAQSWNHHAGTIAAAMRSGAKFIVTSRDYVFQFAKSVLKAQELPHLAHKTVVVDVENLSNAERKQILYNHIKHGTQPKQVRHQLKPFLEKLSENPRLLPEIARRLGHAAFTERVVFSASGLADFVQHPEDHLLALLQNLDNDSRAALILIFSSLGGLPSPASYGPAERAILDRVGGSPPRATGALGNLRGSLVECRLLEGNYRWQLKHPTMHDAVARYLSQSPDALDIWVSNAKIDAVLREAWCDGQQHARGVLVPKSCQDHLLPRIAAVQQGQRSRFLALRCDDAFLARWLEGNQMQVDSIDVGECGLSPHGIPFARRLIALGASREDVEEQVIRAARDDVLVFGDCAEMNESAIQDLLGNDGVAKVKDATARELPSAIDYIVETEIANYDVDSDPDDWLDRVAEFCNEMEAWAKDRNLEFPRHEIDWCIEAGTEACLNKQREATHEADSGGAAYRYEDAPHNQTGDDRSPSFMEHESVFDDVDQ